MKIADGYPNPDCLKISNVLKPQYQADLDISKVASWCALDFMNRPLYFIDYIQLENLGKVAILCVNFCDIELKVSTTLSCNYQTTINKRTTESILLLY